MGKARAVKDVSKGVVDKTRRRLGRSKGDKKCRVHLKARCSLSQAILSPHIHPKHAQYLRPRPHQQSLQSSTVGSHRQHMQLPENCSFHHAATALLLGVFCLLGRIPREGLVTEWSLSHACMVWISCAAVAMVAPLSSHRNSQSFVCSVALIATDEP